MKQTGFTLIELVVVLVVLGILASVAVPRFLNITEDAQDVVVASTKDAFATGLQITKAKWELAGSGALLDINGDGSFELEVNNSGYPIGFTPDGKNVLAEVFDKGESGSDACGQIFQKLVNMPASKIISANKFGECSAGEFCAIATEDDKCLYVHRKTKQRFSYSPNDGEVVLEQ